MPASFFLLLFKHTETRAIITLRSENTRLKVRYELNLENREKKNSRDDFEMALGLVCVFSRTGQLKFTTAGSAEELKNF